MVKWPAMTARCEIAPNGTVAKPQKKPGFPGHGVRAKLPGMPSMVKKQLPNGKKRLTKITSMTLPAVKNSGPGVKTENPGGKNPKRRKNGLKPPSKNPPLKPAA